MTTNSRLEKRLEELREQAWKEGVVPGKDVEYYRRPDSAQAGLLRSALGQTAGLDVGNSDSFSLAV